VEPEPSLLLLQPSFALLQPYNENVMSLRKLKCYTEDMQRPCVIAQAF
jgi:hypothetical protein